MNNNDYVCYLLKSEVSCRTYIGITNNIKKRLRQHNGEIKGGAKYTKINRPWKLILYVEGFPNKSQALSFEWRVKRKRATNGRKFVTVSLLNNRIKNVFDVFRLERFTSKCDLTLDNFYNINFFNKTIYDLVINSNYKENIKNIFLNYNESES